LVYRFDPAQGKYVSTPIDLGGTDNQVILVLFGTGIRGRSSLQNVSVKIGNVEITPSYAEYVPGLVGLDQVNLPLPRSLAGLGEVDLLLTIDGQVTNITRINFR
jgi:uncharacterized protein (TIGR03437 family)